MKVRMIQQMSGPRGDGTDWPPYGGVLDTSEQEGRDLCNGGVAVPVAETRKAETADAPPDAKVEERFTEPPAPTTSAAVTVPPEKRGPGRPPGSTNKPK